jgi:hypothetical protein
MPLENNPNNPEAYDYLSDFHYTLLIDSSFGSFYTAPCWSDYMSGSLQLIDGEGRLLKKGDGMGWVMIILMWS